MNDNLIDKVIGGIAVATFYRGLAFPVQFINVILLARLLEPSHFGIFASSYIIIAFGELLLNQTIRRPLIQIQSLSIQLIRTSKSISIITGCGFYILIVAMANVLESLLAIDHLGIALIVLGISVVIRSASLTSESLLAKDLRFSFLAKLDFLEVLINALSAICLAYFGYGFWTLFLAFILAKIVRTIVVIIRASEITGFQLDHAAVGEIFGAAKGFYLYQLASYISRQSHKLIVGKFLGTDALGIYDRGHWLVNIPLDFFSLVQQTLFPAIATIQGNRPKLQSAYIRSISLTAQVGIPMAVTLAILSEDIVLLFLGDKWARVIPIFEIFGLGVYFRMSARTTSTFLLATGFAIQASKVQLIFALIIIFGALSFVSDGLVPIALVIVVASFLHMLVLGVVACRKGGLMFTEWIFLQLQGVTLGFVVFLPLILISLLNLDYWIELTFALACLICFSIGLVILQPRHLLNSHSIWLLGYLKSRLRLYL